jgi:hypothetical protein
LRPFCPAVAMAGLTTLTGDKKDEAGLKSNFE